MGWENIWENIYRNNLPGSYFEYPSDAFVPIFFKNLKYIKNKECCLDYGCGSGNNSEVLKKIFKKLYLVDISPFALNIAMKRLNLDKSHISTTIRDEWPQMDFILAWQVLYYNNKYSLKKTIDLFYKKLKKGGIILCSIINFNDCKVKLSKKISSNEFIISDDIPHQQGAIVYACKSIYEFISFFENKFYILDYGLFCRKSFLNNKEEINEYYIVGEKL